MGLKVCVSNKQMLLAQGPLLRITSLVPVITFTSPHRPDVLYTESFIPPSSTLARVPWKAVQGSQAITGLSSAWPLSLTDGHLPLLLPEATSASQTPSQEKCSSSSQPFGPYPSALMPKSWSIPLCSVVGCVCILGRLAQRGRKSRGKMEALRSAFSIKSHLIDERGELVVQHLNLLPLLGAHLLDLWVQLYVEGSQEALVDSDLVDAPRWVHGWR